MAKGYSDLGKLSEDERIDAIGRTTMVQQARSDQKPLVIGFVVDDDGTGSKGTRYLAKLQAKFPNIRLIDRKAGPVPHTEMIRVGPPLL